MRRVVTLVSAALLVLVFVPAQPAFATPAGNYVVDDVGDQGDATVGDGVCATSNETCTLRAAVEEANADDAGSTITFAASINGQSIVVVGDIEIDNGMTITGNGVANTVIDGDGEGRIFRIESGDAGDVSISKLTVTNGDICGDGGGILEDVGSTLSLSKVVLTGNEALDCEGSANGGGLAVRAATLTADGLTVTGNHADDNGGGIWIGLQGNDPGAAITLTNSTVGGSGRGEGNTAGGEGGGIAISGQTTSNSVTFDEVTSTGNDAGSDGGGLSVDVNGTGDLTFDHLAVTDNSAVDGGGIFAFSSAAQPAARPAAIRPAAIIGLPGGTPNFTDAVVTGNSANAGDGGGDGGGILAVGDGASIDRALVADNSADAEGGGIYVQTTDTLISNTTIAANTATNGGGIGVGRSSHADVAFATITDNTATDGKGGGLDLEFGTDTLDIGAIIVAANDPQNCDTANTITSHGYSIDDANTCALAATGDLTDTDPQLAPLADNGGFSQTQALLAGSPAVDLVPTSFDPADPTDQRAVSRPQGAARDSGAFELKQAAPPTSSSPAPSTTSPAPSPSASSSAAVAATGSDTSQLLFGGSTLVLVGLLLILGAALARPHRGRHARTRRRA